MAANKLNVLPVTLFSLLNFQLKRHIVTMKNSNLATNFFKVVTKNTHLAFVGLNIGKNSKPLSAK